MTDKPETAAEVLAEMRAHPHRWVIFKQWADRIERAIAAQGEAVGEIAFDPRPDFIAPSAWIERKAVFVDLAALPVGAKLYTAPAPAPARVTDKMVERLAKHIAQKESHKCDSLDAALNHQAKWQRIVPEAREMLTAALGGDHD